MPTTSGRACRAAVPGVEPLGYLVRDEALAIPSRHLGLLTAEEFASGELFWSRLADAAESTIDLDRMLALAQVPALGGTPSRAVAQAEPTTPRLGVPPGARRPESLWPVIPRSVSTMKIISTFSRRRRRDCPVFAPR